MHEGEKAFRGLLDDWRDDPEFVAEGIALELSVAVNASLKLLRMNQKQLAEKIHVSAGRISQIMGGNLNLTLLTMCKVALGVGLFPTLGFSSQPESRALSTGSVAASALTTWANAVVTPGTPFYSATLSYVTVPASGGLSGFATTSPEPDASQMMGTRQREKGAA